MQAASLAREAMSMTPPDAPRAARLAEKAHRLYSCPETQAVLLQAQALAAEAEARAAGGGGGGSARGGAGGASSSGNNTAAPSTEGVRRRTHATTTTPTQTTNANGGATANPEQVELIAAILRARTHYEVLAVPHHCRDDDAVKRGYRQRALKLHPDKCKAPRAAEAFRKVSEAFACLSDADKRVRYERTGYATREEENAAHQAAAARGGAGSGMAARQRSGFGGNGFYYSSTADINPEDIFNAFFGSNPFGGAAGGASAAAYAFANHQQRQRARAAAAAGHGHDAADAAAARAGLASLAQLLPLLLVVFLTLFSSRPEPAYVLTPGGGGDGRGGTGLYRQQLRTSRLEVPFYVRSADDFQRTYPLGSRARQRMDREIEGDHYDRTHVRCQHELLSRQRAAAWGGRAARERAAAMETPFCDELASLNARLGQHQQQRQRQQHGGFFS